MTEGTAASCIRQFAPEVHQKQLLPRAVRHFPV